jgi:hypothetical protein
MLKILKVYEANNRLEEKTLDGGEVCEELIMDTGDPVYVVANNVCMVIPDVEHPQLCGVMMADGMKFVVNCPGDVLVDALAEGTNNRIVVEHDSLIGWNSAVEN